MENLFISVLNMSITAGYCILFIFIIRLCLKRQPKIYSYVLWGIPFLRLVCPVSLQSMFSFVRVRSQTVPQDIAMQTTPEINSGILIVDNTINRIMRNSALLPEPSASVNPLQIVVFVASVVWIVGIAGILLYSILTACRLSFHIKGARRLAWEEIDEEQKRQLQTACLEEAFYRKYPLYVVEGIPTAFVFGVIHPAVYLPADLEEKSWRYVLLHELTHIRRRDYLVKLAAFCITVVHWFNPLVWAAYMLLGNDMEMSCDETVVNSLGKGVKKAYSEALLSLATGHKALQGSPLAFGEGKAGSRIKNILHYKNRTLQVTIVLVAVVGVTAVGLLSSAPEEVVDFRQQTAEEVNASLETTKSKDGFLQLYATSLCLRDGNMMAELYANVDLALKSGVMLGVTDEDIYVMGWSSPWPWDTDYNIVDYPSEDRADIYYYARTSDPDTAVWREEVYYKETEEGYRAVASIMKSYDAIYDLDSFYEAYYIDGQFRFADLVENGTLEAVRYQIANGDAQHMGERFLTPEKAAESILHLAGGSAGVESVSDYQAVVSYTFADGSRVSIPMYQPDSEGSREPGGDRDVWLVDFETWAVRMSQIIIE